MNTLQFLEAIETKQTRPLWCNTWQTWMPHVETSEGWVCACGELHVEAEGTDNSLSGSLREAGFGSAGPM